MNLKQRLYTFQNRCCPAMNISIVAIVLMFVGVSCARTLQDVYSQEGTRLKLLDQCNDYAKITAFLNNTGHATSYVVMSTFQYGISADYYMEASAVTKTNATVCPNHVFACYANGDSVQMIYPDEDTIAVLSVPFEKGEFESAMEQKDWKSVETISENYAVTYLLQIRNEKEGRTVQLRVPCRDALKVFFKDVEPSIKRRDRKLKEAGDAMVFFAEMICLYQNLAN